MADFTKWVACWGTATSISDRNECVYAKDITLRYPIRVCFRGGALRLHFSNLTGTEAVRLEKVRLLRSDPKVSIFLTEEEKTAAVTFKGEESVSIRPGREVVSDEIRFLNAADYNDPLEIVAGETIEVSIYLKKCTQMNAGTLVTGPLSGGTFTYGDYAEAAELPAKLTRSTDWYYFLNTIDILTEESNRALICYGDSITAQSWPDYLALALWEKGIRDVSVIRRAVCGTRIMREYDCLTYAAYGLKGATRFPIETKCAGADAVLIQHGINDIIHPVGLEVNPWRPWKDMPTADDLINSFALHYTAYARRLGYKAYGGTLLPIYGWRTYEPFRDEIRNEFNDWIRTTSELDGVVDFDEAVRDPADPKAFREGFDSGDHLHPSEEAYRAMAEKVIESLGSYMGTQTEP